MTKTIEFKDCIILRYGEMGLKSIRSRPVFERKFVYALNESLERNGISAEIKNYGKRFIIFLDDSKDLSSVVSFIGNVPGVQSFSPCKHIKFNSKEDIIKSFSPMYIDFIKDKEFCIRVKTRVGDHDFSSAELERDFGSELYDYSKGVNLSNPESTVFLEIRKDDCFCYTKSFDGVGGLPPGSSGKVICMFSGGIDSPVAAYEMLKRGSFVDFFIFDNGGKEFIQDVSKVYNFLRDQYIYSYTPRVFVVSAKELLDCLIKVESSFRQIAFKIVLYKVAQILMKKYKFDAIVTGEAISQKSSQTLSSLLFIERQVEVPILRPLLTYDKVDIMHLARHLGTLSFSEKVSEFCNLGDGKVTTSPRLSDLDKMPNLDVEIERAIQNVQVISDHMPISESRNSKNNLSINIEDYFVVDIRSNKDRSKIKIKSNLHLSFSDIYDQFDIFKTSKKYIVVCSYGVRSEDAVFFLKQKKINAIGMSVTDFLKLSNSSS